MPPRVKFTEEEKKEICRLYTDEKLPVSEIMKIIGRARVSIDRVLKDNGIEIDKKAIGRSPKHNRLEDFVGKKFGSLVVVGDSPQNELGRFCALCKCDCGNDAIIPLSDLKSGKRKTCGCALDKYDVSNLVGKRFGKLTILEVLGKNRYNHTQLLVRCDCDKTKEVGLYGVMDGRTISCGCYGAEILKANVYHTKAKLGEKYPTFCKVEEVRDNPDGYGVIVRCKKCGKWFPPTTYQLTSRIRAIERPESCTIGTEFHLYCSDECKYSCPLYHALSDPYAIKDYSNQPTQYELAIWSNQCFSIQYNEIGTNRCEICGEEGTQGNPLASHHIEPKKMMPGYALDPTNGIILCRRCHFDYGHQDECSTGSLAKIICNK